jgi:MOSC domain-containing protein YiiM
MKVERIFTIATSGGDQQDAERVSVIAGKGIEGDRYYDRHEEPGQNITLVELEVLEAFLREHPREGGLGITHRNVVVSGVRLNDLVGREFTVGDVRLRGADLCEPCMGLGGALASDALPAHEVVRWFAHRGGLRADVLTSGVIARGAIIRTD